MSATHATRGIRLGEILVDQGLLTAAQVEQILNLQQEQGRPFGVLAERLFGLDPRDVEGAWVEQYAALTGGEADVDAIGLDPRCMKLVNRRQAWQFHCAPVCREDGEIVVLTDERHLPKALRFAASTFREPTYFRLVDGETLQAFLMEHYPVPEFLADYATAR